MATCGRSHDKLYQLQASHPSSALHTMVADVSNENDCRRLMETTIKTVSYTHLDVYKRQRKNGALLINWKDKIIPVKIRDIALFSIEYKMTQVITFDNQQYYINQPLDELEQICGLPFYRANRQYLVNRDAISEALQYFARKLVLKLKVKGDYEVIISKNRVPDFLEWLKE